MRNLWKKLVLAAGMTGVASLSGVAIAAEPLPPRAPAAAAPAVVVRPFTWAGPYIGAQVGFDWNELNFRPPPPLIQAKPTGAVAGVFAGFNHLIIANGYNWFWGLDANFNWDGAHTTVCTPSPCTVDVSVEWKASLRGRLGVAFNRFFVYGTLGVASERVTSGDGFPGTATPTGWTGGLGVDWALTDTLFLRGDWAFQNFDSFNLNGSGGPVINDTGNTVTVGLGLKFPPHF